MNNDHTFGYCIKSDRTINDQERLHLPDSLDTLNEKTGHALREYLFAAIKLPSILHNTSIILWIVDVDGNIQFAAEELIDIKTGRLAAVRPRGDWGDIPGTLKLGHPSLLKQLNKFARIGGEIVYNLHKSRWEINNFSGRYGMRPQTEKRHLEAVARKFAQYGINLYIDFERP